MSDKRFLQNGFEKNLSHAIEECGEFLAAAGKTQRWGVHSSNPIYSTAPDGSRGEANSHWLWREMQDLQAALKRLKKAMINDFDKGVFDQDKDGNWRED